MSADEIILLVALKAEAKPLIRAFGLQRKQPDGAFPRYINGPLSLVLTGPGAEAARQAARFSLSLTTSETASWINLGIAGHARLAPGSCLLAETVRQPDSGQEWQLQTAEGLQDLALGPLHSVNEAETDYAEAAAYDMEAAAIADTFCQAGQLHRLQVVKVISDNPDHPARGISARMVSELIEAQLPLIESLISHLRIHA